MLVSVFIKTKEQLDLVSKYNIKDIYTDNLELATKYNLYYETPRAYNNNLALPNKLLINDLGLLISNSNKDIVSNYYLNVGNHYTLDLLLEHNVKKINLSIETKLDELSNFDYTKYPIEYLVYGRVEVMLIKTHPLLNEDGYTIEGMDGKKYPVLIDNDKHTRILSHRPINHLDDIEYLKSIGLNNIRLDFTIESIKEIESILNKLYKLI